jgi:hypothetical protein
LLAADRESAAGVEEVQVAGIYREFDPVAGPDRAMRVDSRRPQGLSLVKRDRRFVFLLLRAKVGDILVLDGRRIDAALLAGTPLRRRKRPAGPGSAGRPRLRQYVTS